MFLEIFGMGSPQFYSQMSMVVNVCECMHNELHWCLTVCMLFVTLHLMFFTVLMFFSLFSSDFY